MMTHTETQTLTAPAPAPATAQPVPMELTPSLTSTLDLSYLRASSILTYQGYTRIQILLVGCGGTGSWLAPNVARIARALIGVGKRVEINFVDPDIVEEANCTRQNFSLAEIGLYKASTLAYRYTAAWGVPIATILEPFNPAKMIDPRPGTLVVLLGCVDNAAARQQMETALLMCDDSAVYRTQIWWIDLGNGRDAGQCLIGSKVVKQGVFTQMVSQAFGVAGLCSALPAPSVQMPDLLVPRPEEAPDATENLSCEQLALMNAQSMMVNQRLAVEGSDYLLRLLVTHDLRRFQTFMDLPSGVSRSTYVTQENVTRVITEGIRHF